MRFRVLVPVLLLLATGSCDSGPGALPSVFSSSVTEVVIEVDYEVGAEPYTGATLLGDTWDLFKTNAKAVFSKSSKTLTVPSTLGEMQQLADLAGEDFTVDAILDLAGQHRNQANSAATRSYYVLFLDGYFFDDGVRQPNVLGVSLGQTGVIAMFKPVISGGADPASATPTTRFVEQSVMIHEFGHAIGLVNNGLALTSAHHDAEHGAHCANTACVMYYLNEGLSDLKQFVGQYVTSGATTLFDQACLEDAYAASGAAP